ncbi:stalk domain-containing protein [Alkalicoccus chagannorensis]|uniref:stalk domain-containing protein n=1 Tax=Alkalicoccus chagannorensis TaxID=427072 RepID=UPI0004089E56|nr:NlpC/P60 family protein [Alkalicoccus chagannorensis]
MLKWIGILAAALLLTVTPFFEKEASASGTADQIISAGESQLGTPYQWGGTTTSGFDCSGFTGYAFSQAGIDLPRTAQQQFSVGTSVSRSNLQPGDLVFFSESRSASRITHNGIYIGNNQMIHSSSSQGVSIVSLSSSYWSPRYVGAKRVVQDTHAEVASASSQEPSYDTVDVQVNGSEMNLDQDAVKKDGRTLVPMRAIFEELGATVQWDAASNTVTGSLNGTQVQLTIGDTTAYVQGEAVSLDQEGELINSRTMVPLRFVGEALGAYVDWDGSTNTVIVSN